MKIKAALGIALLVATLAASAGCVYHTPHGYYGERRHEYGDRHHGDREHQRYEHHQNSGDRYQDWNR